MLRILFPLIGLVKERMQLNLIQTRRYPRFLDQAFIVLRQEITHSNGSDISAFFGLDQRLPCLDIHVLLRIGPVNQIQVVIIQIRSVQGFLDRHECFILSVITPRQLRGNEQFFSGDGALLDRSADRCLILIVIRRIN
ncbi:hypothetical protein D3C74_378410 [compost metagenome]